MNEIKSFLTGNKLVDSMIDEEILNYKISRLTFTDIHAFYLPEHHREEIIPYEWVNINSEIQNMEDVAELISYLQEKQKEGANEYEFNYNDYGDFYLKVPQSKRYETDNECIFRLKNETIEAFKNRKQEIQDYRKYLELKKQFENEDIS